jgi:hypothetical protein
MGRDWNVKFDVKRAEVCLAIVKRRPGLLDVSTRVDDLEKVVPQGVTMI